MADTDNAAVESKARALGWVPKEEFRGDESRWVDAEAFVKRGEEIMPLLKANNQRLQTQVEDLQGQLNEAQQAIKDSQESMAALLEHQSEATLQAVKETKARLRTQIRTAREAQDWDALDELEEQLDTVRDTERSIEAKKTPPKPTAAPAAPRIDPEFAAWQKENTWFGSDKRLTAMMLAEGQIMREEEKTPLRGRAFYEEAAARAQQALNPKPRNAKVDGGTGDGTPSTRNNDTGGRTYASLPPEAKAACERQAKSLVGPNRAFKDMASWQKHYAEQYYIYSE